MKSNKMHNPAVRAAGPRDAEQARLAHAALESVVKGLPVGPDQLSLLMIIGEGPYVLIGIRPSTRKVPADAVDQKELSGALGHSIVQAADEQFTFVMTTQANAQHVYDHLTEKGKSSSHVVVTSLPFSDVEDVHQQLQLVLYCLSTSTSASFKQAKTAALGFIVDQIKASAEYQSLLHPALETLSSYDRDNQSNLLETLRVYLEQDRNAQRCANILYLHRNSLQYRVRRIQEIAGIDLDDVNERMYLRLSFLLST